MSTTTAPRRAAVYLRVSLDATGEGLAVDRQREACLAIIAARGWVTAGEYVDNSISATDAKKNRPGYNRLVEDLAAGRFDALVCYDLDRLTRQPRQLEDWIDAADTGALALVTANGEADLTNDAGRLFARIKLAVARSEVERKSVRQRDAARQRSEIGRPPLGVRLTGYTPKGELVPEEAAIVRQAFDRFTAGETLRGIARSFTDAGVTTRHGKPWNASSIRSMLTNPRYAGRAIYQGQETGGRGAWTPIVTDAEFDAAQALLRDETRRTQVSTARRHLGSGIYLCGVCDEPVSAWSGKRYRCRDGAHVNRAQGAVDRFVEFHLLGGDPGWFDPTAAGEVIPGYLASPAFRMALNSDTDTAPLLATIDRHKRLVRRAADDYQAELIDGALYKRTRDGAARAIREAEDRLATITSGSASAPVTGAADPVEAYKAADLTTRRAVVDALLTVRLHPGHRYSRTFDPSTVSVDWKATAPAEGIQSESPVGGAPMSRAPKVPADLYDPDAGEVLAVVVCHHCGSRVVGVLQERLSGDSWDASLVSEMRQFRAYNGQVTNATGDRGRAFTVSPASSDRSEKFAICPNRHGNLRVDLGPAFAGGPGHRRVLEAFADRLLT